MIRMLWKGKLSYPWCRAMAITEPWVIQSVITPSSTCSETWAARMIYRTVGRKEERKVVDFTTWIITRRARNGSVRMLGNIRYPLVCKLHIWRDMYGLFLFIRIYWLFIRVILFTGLTMLLYRRHRNHRRYRHRSPRLPAVARVLRT